MRLIGKITAFCTVSLLLPSTALAANCASRDALVSRLESMYSEKLTARGLQSATTLMEVFASAESGTFTVLVTNAKGHSCIVGAGTNWQTRTNPTYVVVNDPDRPGFRFPKLGNVDLSELSLGNEVNRQFIILANAEYES